MGTLKGTSRDDWNLSKNCKRSLPQSDHIVVDVIWRVLRAGPNALHMSPLVGNKRASILHALSL